MRDCIDCFTTSTVVDSRPRLSSVWRKRVCRKCKKSFHTMEIRQEYLESLRDVKNTPEDVIEVLLDTIDRIKGVTHGKEVIRD